MSNPSVNGDNQWPPSTHCRKHGGRASAPRLKIDVKRLERLPVDDVRIELWGIPEAHIFMFWMGRVADGIEVFGIAWRIADVFWRITTGGLEQEGSPSVVALSNHFSSLITWSQLSPKS